MNQNSIEKTTYDIVTAEEAIKDEKNNIIAHFLFFATLTFIIIGLSLHLLINPSSYPEKNAWQLVVEQSTGVSVLLVAFLFGYRVITDFKKALGNVKKLEQY